MCLLIALADILGLDFLMGLQSLRYLYYYIFVLLRIMRIEFPYKVVQISLDGFKVTR